MLELYEEIIEEKELHLTARRGIISLLEKVNKNREKIGSWRPISLLSSDYKILSKLIARRLNKVIMKIVHESETGFIPGRLMGENIIKLLNLMDYCEKSKSSALVVSFDFQKAFDKVKWTVIDLVLDQFNFGPYFKRLVQILYVKPLAAIMNNGYWGEWITLERSTRQGCCSSALIFALVVEILGLKIRANVNIIGIRTQNFEYVATQYADDIWVAILPTEQNLQELITTMEKFCEFSGLTLNYEKSVAIKLGPCRDSEAKYYSQKQLSWTKDPIKILGIWFHPDRELMEKKNFEEKLDKIKQILKQWSKRNLTIMGKIVLIESLVVSQLNNLFMYLPPPNQSILKCVKDEIINFLWGKGSTKIRYSKIIQKYEEGGLKLPDIETKQIAAKMIWIKYLYNNECCWFYQDLPLQDSRIFLCNLEESNVKIEKNNLFQFGKWVLKYWAKINYSIPVEKEEIKSQLLWGNARITRKLDPFFDPELTQSNIEYVYQIINSQEKRFMNLHEIQEIHGCILSPMLYNQLKAAIPVTWKTTLKYDTDITECETVETNFEKKEKAGKITAPIYWHLIEKRKTLDATKFLWERELQKIIDETEWEKIFVNIFKVTQSVKLRFFHYQIINRILSTNSSVAKWNKDISKECTLCNNYSETIIHLLVECEKVKTLWRNLEKWLKYFHKIEISLDKESILLNNYKDKHSTYVNLMILIMKRYIYVTRCEESDPKFNCFVQKIHEQYRIERIVANKKDMWQSFQKRWRLYLGIQSQI